MGINGNGKGGKMTGKGWKKIEKGGGGLVLRPKHKSGCATAGIDQTI